MAHQEKKMEMPGASMTKKTSLYAGAGTTTAETEKPKKKMPGTEMTKKIMADAANGKKKMPATEMTKQISPKKAGMPMSEIGGNKPSSGVNMPGAAKLSENAKMPAFQMANPTTGPGIANKAATNEELVLTPGGWRPKSKVHFIEPGHHVSGEGNKLRKIHTETGRVIADLGDIPKKYSNEPNMPKNVHVPQDKKVPAVAGSVIPDYGTGWIAYSGWTNDTGQPLSSFSTNWIVPPAPETNSGQTIFLFNGIQNSAFILQPVLQWGPSYGGGGNYWAIANWYADGQGGAAMVSSLVQVNPGDNLQGIMTLTGQSGSSFSYQSTFTQYPATALQVNDIEQLTWANETLEVYGITQCSDYPSTNETTMTNIEIKVGGNTEANINWQSVNAFTECGQHCNIVSNASPGGEVDLFYSNAVTGPWSGWNSLGGWIDMLTVGQNQDGRLEGFARGGDGAVWHNWQTTPNGNWSGWNSLGGWIDIISVGKNADGRLEIFARGGDGAVWHNWQTTPNGNWSGWDSLGGWIDMLTVGQNQDGRLEIFARGGDGAVWHNWQTTPNGNWSGWDSLGGWIDMLTVGQNQDGRLEVFARGGDGAVWHNWQTTPNGNWGGWDSLGSWIDIITVGKNEDGRLEIFARGGDGAVWHNWQTAPNGNWSGWDSLGGWIDMLTAGNNQDGRLEIFARGGDAAIWHIWQTTPNGNWCGWDSLGGWIDKLAVGQNADGRLEVFARGSDAAVWHNWQTAPNF